MLFNSYTFLLVFLPLTVIVFHLIRRVSFRHVLGWLVVMSLVYYGWWNPDPGSPWSPKYLVLIIGSCLGNYYFGRFLAGHRHRKSGKWTLGLGVGANLALLGYYKYLGFFSVTMEQLTGWSPGVAAVALPLGISFFTFQQIAYLVDAHRGETEEYHLTDYFLFVTFFPQLIAGPIVHHKEMMPQFRRHHGQGVKPLDLAIGITFLASGLFKKVVMADGFARYATPIFSLAEEGARDPTMAEAWVGTVSYTLQIYFDFSGYSDMAIGCARMFGIRLPLNFASPYKAVSVIDFWRRWHITLSRFLRDYLYISLGGNRKGPSRRYVNLMLTMLLGGLWHGAGWTFVIWGGLHGAYLCANHGWARLRQMRNLRELPRPLAIMLTLLAVMVAWIYFRASSFEAANTMLSSLTGMNGFGGWPEKEIEVASRSRSLRLIVGGIFIVWVLPNTQQWLARYRPALDFRRPAGTRRWHQWRPTWPWAVYVLVLLFFVARSFDEISEFIYFQF